MRRSPSKCSPPALHVWLLAIVLCLLPAAGQGGTVADTGQTHSFTTVYGEDADYLIAPPSFTPHGNGTVTDNNTGLVWQQHDDGIRRTWTDAITYCAGLSLAGAEDWRLPGRFELLMLVDYGWSNPSIDAAVFPGTDSGAYWTSTLMPDDPTWVFRIHFSSGYALVFDLEQYPHELSRVRCVRGSSPPTGRFVDNGDSTVTDGTTMLMWQQTEGGDMPWEAALHYCEGLTLAGRDDWRLPNVKELHSLVDDSKFYPAVDADYFPGVKPKGWYVTSTTAQFDDRYTWSVYFGVGQGTCVEKDINSPVRCVRSDERTNLCKADFNGDEKVNLKDIFEKAARTLSEGDILRWFFGCWLPSLTIGL